MNTSLSFLAVLTQWLDCVAAPRVPKSARFDRLRLVIAHRVASGIANGFVRSLARVAVFVIAWCCQGFAGLAHAAEVPVIAAASDLQQAMSELVAEFTARSGRSVKLSMGASGNLARQIIQGAPFEVFFSADEAYVLDLARRGLTVDEGVRYGVGRLVLFVPGGSGVKADAELKDLGTALADGRLRKLSIANPEHAPYGRAARAALMHQGLWEGLGPRLVLGENVAQAAQFAVTGSVQAAIIAHSLVLSDALKGRGESVLLPSSWHPPLAQRMVLLKGAGDTARQFYSFVRSAPARAVLNRYGFTTTPDTQ